MEWQGLTTREWASVFWLVVLVVVVCCMATRHVLALLRTVVTSWQMLACFGWFGAWIVAVCYSGQVAGVWNRGLVKDTIA